MHCIKLVFESVKQILCRSMFHCEQALYLLLLELLEVVSICLHWKLMVTSAKMIVVEQPDSVRSQSATNNCSWEPFWIELREFLCWNWEYIFQILCRKVKVTWLPENWGTLWIFNSYFVNSWKLNKCFHYDILPLTARYIYNSNQFMNISKFPLAQIKVLDVFYQNQQNMEFVISFMIEVYSIREIATSVKDVKGGPLNWWWDRFLL